MIITETIKINDRELIRTYSDNNFMIERDGVQYNEAIDPIGFNRTYTETDIKIEYSETDSDYAEAGKILLGVSE